MTSALQNVTELGRLALARFFPVGVRKWLIVGLAIRLVLGPFLQFTYDPVVWFNTGNDMLAGLGPYRTRTYSYPPFWAFTYFIPLWIISRLASPAGFGLRIHQLDWSSLTLGFYSPTILSPVFLLAIKIPLILADLAVGATIFRLYGVTRKFAAGKRAYIFWTLNPLVIWTSSIHGMFDVLPTLFTLISLLFLSRRNYLRAGASLAAGIMYKLYGIYLIPFLIVLTWTNLGRETSLRHSLVPSFKRVARLFIGLAMPVAIFLPFVSLSDLLHPVSVRLEYLSSVGGLSPWGFANLPSFDWAKSLAAANISVIQAVTSLAVFGFSFYWGIRLSRVQGLEVPDLALGMLAVIASSYLTLFTVNPQYLIWLLPFLALVIFGRSVYEGRGMLLSLVGVTYQVALSTLLIFAPLLYTGLGREWAMSLSSTSTLSQNLSVLSGILGLVIYLSFLFAKYKKTPGPRGVTSLRESDGHREGNSSLDISTVLLGSLLVVLVVSAILVAIPGNSHLQPGGFSTTTVNGSLRLSSSFDVGTSQLPLDLTILASPLATLGPDKKVYIYYDPAYPAMGNDLRGWIGIIDHLTAELQLRGYSGGVRLVDAASLRQLMLQDHDSIIIVPSGVLPDTVHNSTESLVGNWLRSGGTLVWMGAIIGFYSGRSGRPVAGLPEPNLGLVGEERILGYRLVEQQLNDSSRMSTLDTSFSTALGLAYSDVWDGPTVAALKSVGGTPIGRLQNMSDTSRVSIASLPVGQGTLILFGGPVTPQFTPDGEEVVSHDVAQLLLLGNLAPGLGIEYATYNVPTWESSTLTLTLTFNNATIIKGLVVAAFSNHDFSRIYWRTQIPTG